MGIRIDDLVAPEAKAELTAFLATMESVKSKYVDICQSMVQGINVKVSVVGDVEKLDELIKVQSREMVTATNQMQTASNQLQTAWNRCYAPKAAFVRYSTGVRMSRLSQFFFFIYQPINAAGKVPSVRKNQCR